MFAALNVTTAIAWLRFFLGRAACDRNGLGIAFQAARRVQRLTTACSM